jgi:hypothetical protein
MSNIPLRTLRRTRKQNARTEGYTPLQDTSTTPYQDADLEMQSTVVTASSAAARRNIGESKGKRKARYIDDSGEEEMLLGGQESRDDGNTDEEIAKGRPAVGLGREQVRNPLSHLACAEAIQRLRSSIFARLPGSYKGKSRTISFRPSGCLPALSVHLCI